MDGVTNDKVNALLSWRGKGTNTLVEHTREVVREEKLSTDAMDRIAALEAAVAELQRAMQFIAEHAVAKVDLTVEHIK